MRLEHREPRPGEITSFLSSKVGWMKGGFNGGSDIKFRPCPCCNGDNKKNPPIQINEKTGLWRCFRCGKTGNWFMLTKAFGCPLPKEDRYKAYNLTINWDIRSEFDKQKRRPVTGNHYPELLTYCHDRGLGNTTLDSWRVTTKGNNCLRFPIFASSGDNWVMVNAKVKVCLRKEKANLHEWFDVRGGTTGLLIGNHLLDINGPKRAIIFEGQIDAMTAYQMGMRNVFSLPNGAENVKVGEMLRYIPDDWEVWVCSDNDEAGEKCAEKFFAQLGSEKCARVILPEKDLNDWYVKNPIIDEKDFNKCVKGFTQQIKVENIRTSFMKLSMEEDDEEDSILATSPWGELNDLLAGGFRSKQTTGILAPSGIGKTTLCNQLAAHSARSGVMTGLISLEGSRNALKSKFRALMKGMCKEEEYQHTFDHLIISSLEGPMVPWQECIEEFKIMILSGCKVLIWDNIDHITRNNHQGKVEAYAALLDLASSNEVHIINVWQPGKIDRNQKVNSGSQKGYSQVFQDSDNYLTLNRFEQDYCILEVEKARDQGITPGKNQVILAYDKATRIYHESKREACVNGITRGFCHPDDIPKPPEDIDIIV